MTSTSIDRRSVLWFVAWMVVGVGFAFSFLALLSIGVFVLAFTVVGTIILASRAGSRVGLPGLISGLGLPLLFVAFVNRSGPGTVCTTTPTSVSCAEQSSPWPWLAIGIVLLAAGIVWFAKAGRPRVATGL